MLRCYYAQVGHFFPGTFTGDIVADPDPGSKIEKNQDPVYGMNIPDHFSESLETASRVNNT
jgi:hypothetical protein